MDSMKGSHRGEDFGLSVGTSDDADVLTAGSGDRANAGEAAPRRLSHRVASAGVSSATVFARGRREDDRGEAGEPAAMVVGPDRASIEVVSSHRIRWSLSGGMASRLFPDCVHRPNPHRGLGIYPYGRKQY
jgi:hypothetical protein